MERERERERVAGKAKEKDYMQHWFVNLNKRAEEEREGERYLEKKGFVIIKTAQFHITAVLSKCLFSYLLEI